MKLTLLLTSLLFSFSTYAFEDGTYDCGSREDFFEISYKIKTLTVNGVDLPHLDVTQNYYKKPTDPNSKDHSYQLKGIANVFTDESGQEILTLGNITLNLVAGKVNCKK